MFALPIPKVTSTVSPTATSDVTDQQFPAAAIIRFGQLVRNLASVLGNHDCDDGGLKRTEHTLRHAVQCLQSEMPDGLAPEFGALFAIHAEAAMSPDELHVLAESLSGWLSGLFAAHHHAGPDTVTDLSGSAPEADHAGTGVYI